MSDNKCCEMCSRYVYDDEDDCYYCTAYFDEDEAEKIFSVSGAGCPYFDGYDEYKILRKQN